MNVSWLCTQNIKQKKMILSREGYIEKINSLCEINEKGCYEWTLLKNKGGYGRITVLNVKKLAHKFLMELHLNRELLPGEEVRHLCHNPACCNISHLKVGTHVENMQDAVRVGRMRNHYLGEANNLSKLKTKEVQEIKQFLREGKLSQTTIGKMYGVTISAIHNIKKGRTWAHVD